MSRKVRKRSLVKACLLAGWKKVKRNEWPSFSLKELEKSLELGNIINRGIKLKTPICNDVTTYYGDRL